MQIDSRFWTKHDVDDSFSGVVGNADLFIVPDGYEFATVLHLVREVEKYGNKATVTLQDNCLSVWTKGEKYAIVASETTEAGW